MFPEDAGKRTLFFAPLIAQAIGAIAFFVASVLAWGVARPYSPVDWVPTIAGPIIGGPILAGALYGMWILKTRIAGPFHVRMPQVLLGLGALCLLVFITVSGASQIGNHERYRERWEQRPSAEAAKPSSILEPDLFLLLNVVIVFPGPISWLIYSVHWLYVSGFEPISDQVEGLDPVGEIMKNP